MRTVPQLLRVLLGAALTVGALAGPGREIGAQPLAVSAAYNCGPGGGPGGGCSTVRFTLRNTTASLLEILGLSLGTSSAAYQFAETMQGSNAGIFSAVDDLSPPPDGFSGATQIIDNRRQLNIDFTEAASLPPFTLGAQRSGFVDVELVSRTSLQPGAFTYAAFLPGDQRAEGQVTVATTNVVPEPSTYLLMATGLGGIALAARRRRVQN